MAFDFRAHSDLNVVPEGREVVHLATDQLDPKVKARLKKALQEQIANKIASEGIDPNGDEARDEVHDLIRTTVEKAMTSETVLATMGLQNSTRAELAQMAAELTDLFHNEFLGFGPITHLLDPDRVAERGITEIMVNPAPIGKNGEIGRHEVWIETRTEGKVFLPSVRFDDNDHVNRVMSKICGMSGREINERFPICDACLPDGSRFNGTMYPIAPDGSTFNIRLFSDDMLSLAAMVRGGTLTGDMAQFLVTCVKARCSIMVSGGTGSGKTTMLNALAEHLPVDDRIITIEDVPELRIAKTHHHTVRLQARKANVDGSGEVTLDELLEATLRKNPDRIVVGECRGQEAYTMLEAMNTGHEGGMTTIHANDPVSSLNRLMTLVRSHEGAGSEAVVKEKIASAIDIIVQTELMSDHKRRVTAIEVIGGYTDGNIQHDKLFTFDVVKVENGRIIGRHRPTGSQPFDLRQKIQNAGLPYEISWFEEVTAKE